jgi:hypothetical protein
MTYVYHKDVSTGDIHIAPDKTYADQTARLAATFVAADIDKLLKQTSDGSFWRVTTAGAPGTSVPFAPPVPVVGDIGKSLVVESDGASGVRFAYDTGGILWSRAGTVLSPQTSGDTVNSGAGAVGAPGFGFTTATNTGIYSGGALQVDIACGGVNTGSFIQTFGLFLPDSLELTGAASNIVLESNTQTSGNVVSIECTPGAAGTADIVKILAEGANWSGGNCLKLQSADASCNVLSGGTDVAETFSLTRGGSIQMSGSINLSGGDSIVTTANGDITLLPNGTGITIVGSGSTSHSLASNNDALVSGELEVDGVLWADSFIRMLSNNALGSDNLGLYGTFIPRNTNQTPDAPLLTTGTASNSFIICEFADRTTDFANALRTDPTFIFQSADATDVTKRSYVSWNEMTIGGGKGSYLGIKSITEEVTVSVGTGSAGVTTSGNLAPANSNIKGIAVKVTQAAGSGALSADIGITGSGNQDELIDAMDVTSLTSQVSPGGNDGTQLPIQNGSATTLTITTDFDVGTSDLKIRIVTYYEEFTAPTS